MLTEPLQHSKIISEFTHTRKKYDENIKPACFMVVSCISSYVGDSYYHHLKFENVKIMIISWARFSASSF